MYDNITKAIKIECYQNMPNYKRPSSIQFQESFKLPPYSTVIGMIHKVCNCKNGEYMPMKVSIQGETKSSLTDLYTRYFFGIKYDPQRHQLKVKNPDGSFDGITRGLGYAEVIVDVNLIIHIVPEDESLFDFILKGLKNPYVYPALGRHEDILRIDNVSIIETEKTDEIEMFYDAYMPYSMIDNIRNNEELIGTVYNLNKVFDINKKTNIRYWKEKVKAKYINKGSVITFKKEVIQEKESKLGLFLA